jgi:protein LTV1
MDEFLEEKKDGIFMEGTRHLAEKRRTGGSSFAALVGKQLVHASDLNDYNTENLAVHEEAPLEEQLQDANETLAKDVMEPPPEEVLIDGKSYFSERTRNPWDCESILSTYSNLDNNPVTIDSKRRRKKKKQQQQVSPVESLPEEEPVHIKLSSKTGLPIRYIEEENDYDEEDDTMVSRNRGEARNKKETKEEKKARKLAVKKEREIARIQKKMMKEAFKDEFALRSEDATDEMGGKSVFRYS